MFHLAHTKFVAKLADIAEQGHIVRNAIGAQFLQLVLKPGLQLGAAGGLVEIEAGEESSAVGCGQSQWVAQQFRGDFIIQDLGNLAGWKL
ncbi:MAG: hypothetical protein Q8N51_19370, partial [Gammaproteobacteria bacterium]|nr:hypothetical protein [Gammaproteobacteria bacterium]